ncbi:HEAT repeat domain-containing protein [Corallococcus sp. bb12-1]|uniref:HEAT repeat domain-containing protein n=1 Tax=Corallococcus sp. bb12-1 TaxID=2996784 RepID=UPI00226F07CD|nr:HEAT repeat domain-containing protein [Corallococcus sp. bb12-1]MCY1044814.1 HEAT repeat domain-containing protein [Corallococcus sp. bb12-1]
MTHDGRTVEALVAAALRGELESSEAWEAVDALHRRGGEAVFLAASALLRSPRPKERVRGADILAQLTQPSDVRPRCVERMLPMLQEEADAQVLQALVLGLGHLRDERVPRAIAPLRDHPSAKVRGAVLLALLKAPESEPPSLLLSFVGDADEGVRGLAMVHLRGLPDEADAPELREVLLRRLDDASPTIRAEAVLVLARRKDARVLEPLRKALRRSRVRLEFIDAAGALGDASLLPLLRALGGAGRDDDVPFTRTLAQALAALERVA